MAFTLLSSVPNTGNVIQEALCLGNSERGGAGGLKQVWRSH